eukprot:scaffold6007_cov183-Amphora_coffeaeformis.AAC.5
MLFLSVRLLITDEGVTLLQPILLWLYDLEKGAFLLLAINVQEVVNGFLKWTFQVPRPFWVVQGVTTVGSIWEQAYSFPSSHAQTGSTYVVALGCFGIHQSSPVLFGFAVLLCLLAGLSRVYLGVHTMYHVLTGWIIGIFITTALWQTNVVDRYFALDDSVQWPLIPAWLVSCYLILYTIRSLVPPPPSSTLEAWNRMAWSNSLKNGSETENSSPPQEDGINDAPASTRNVLQPRRLNKYDLQIWSTVGGMAGSIFGANDASGYSLLVLRGENDVCDDSDTSAWIPIARFTWCFAVLVLVLMPVGFLGPVLIRKALKGQPTVAQVLGAFVRCSSFCLVGFWAIHGCPRTAYGIIPFKGCAAPEKP